LPSPTSKRLIQNLANSISDQPHKNQLTSKKTKSPKTVNFVKKETLKNRTMNLKELLEKDFGVKLPISGGIGYSIENAIIIHRATINNYVGTEHIFLSI
jgi:hypothetical protein